jgi:PAS domain S-box-containing protein
MKDELQLSKQMLEDITQGITESIILLSRDHKILWANKTTADMTGLPMSELLGSCCYKVTHHRDKPCEAPEDPCPIHQLLKTGTTQMEEHLHYDLKGNKVYVEVKAYPVKNEAGEIIEIIHITRDITQRKMMEQERENLIRELREAISKVKTLSGMLPICANCKKIRDDQGYWNQIESYIRRHSSAEFTHGLCPECAKKMMGE